MPTATNGATHADSAATSQLSSTPLDSTAPAAPAAPSVLEVLKAFQETQERRVAHWAEYDEALNAFMAQSVRQGRGGAGGPVGGSRNDAGEIRAGGSEGEAQESGHRCCGQPSSSGAAPTTTGTQRGEAQPSTPLSEELMTRILGLVTSGLLDCGHTTRALSSELKAGNIHFSPRPDLAKLLSDVQELENKLLRSVVKRDQARRKERVEERDLQDEIAESQRDVEGCKREIGEAMEEVSAEVADLVAAEG